jgi:DNA-binding beta-propeller fold protein YncE
MGRRLSFGIAVVLAATTATAIDATVAIGGPTSSEPVVSDPGDGDERPAGTVWVVNRELGEVAIFDARTGEVLAQQPAGAGAHDVAISDGAQSAYITNENEDTVSIVSTRQPEATKIDLGPQPHHVEVSRDGDKVAVGLVGTNAVAVIDAATGETENVTSSANAAAAAHGPYLVDDTLYVAHETGDEVTAIDTATGEIAFSIGGISQPTEVLPDASEQLLYVSARGEGAIKVVDLATQSIVEEIEVGEEPETMLLTGDEGTLIVSMRGTPARLAFIDTATLAVTDLVDLAGSDTSGDLAAMSDDDRVVYATFDRGETGTGGVAVVDVETRAVIDTWDYPGVGRVHGIAYTSQTPQSP